MAGDWGGGGKNLKDHDLNCLGGVQLKKEAALRMLTVYH